jgi:hypothetical protein
MLREWYKLGIDLGYVYEKSSICWPDADGAISDTAPPSADDLPRLADGTPVTPSLLREWHKLCLHKVESYATHPDWEELPAETVMIYRQSAQPGARSPHVWLKDGRSTLDLFGPGFALLRVGADAPGAQTICAAAEARYIPLTVVVCGEPEVAAAYERKLVLVRPDGHVAWRGDDWPSEGVDALLDRVVGADAQPR